MIPGHPPGFFLLKCKGNFSCERNGKCPQSGCAEPVSSSSQAPIALARIDPDGMAEAFGAGAGAGDRYFSPEPAPLQNT